MRLPKLIPVMEGHGEVEALSFLMRRVVQDRFMRYDVNIGSGPRGTVRAPGRGQLEKDLGKYLRHAIRKPDCAGILVLMDADKDCPLGLVEKLRQQCTNSGVNVPVEVVCAKEEYEVWFLASIDTIRSQANIPADRTPALAVEEQSSPKAWLSHNMPFGRAYKPTLHQEQFTAHIDLQLAYDESRSFRRLCHALEQLMDAVANKAAQEK